MATTFTKQNEYSFKTGNLPHNKPRKYVKSCESGTRQAVYSRLTRKMTSLVQNIPYKDVETNSGHDLQPAILLRPKDKVPIAEKKQKSIEKNQRAEDSTNRTVNVKQNAIMWNQVFREHRALHPNCDGFIEWNMKKEEKFGLVNREEAMCSNCTYQSKKFKLYEEVASNKPGRRAAKINTSAQAALSQTPLGYTGFRKIILGCNIPAPTVTGLQKRANKVLPEITKINKEDMTSRRKKIIEINKLRGRKNPEAVSMQADGAYNNAIYAGIGKTPFQPATQVVYTVAESETEDKSIIAVVCKNKLCSVHPIKSSEECGPQCSSNITFMKSIGDEYTWAKEALRDIKSDGLEPKHITTDPDSSAFRAAEDLYAENVTSTKPEHFLDTRHFLSNQRKTIKREKDLVNIMPGRTKAERQKQLNNFSHDLAERCQTEFNIATENYGGDFHKIKNKMSYVVDAVTECYTGNHELCRRHSFVCKGGKKQWLMKRPFLQSTFQIQKSKHNLDAIRKCVNYRLNPKALKQTRLNLNTQKVEAFNRSLRRSLPKNVTFSKNFEGRTHAAIHSVNLGPGESLMMICEQLGAPIPSGSAVEKGLKSLQNTDSVQKKSKKTIKSKKSRADTRKYLYKIHAVHQEEKNYVKNKLLPASLSTTKKVRSKQDHPYAKRPKQGQ